MFMKLMATTLYKSRLVGYIFAVGLILSFVGTLLTEHTAGAGNDATCGAIEVVFARGSGQELSKSPESSRFDSLMSESIKSPLTYNFYELGSQKQAGYQYPAVDISNVFNGNAIGAWVSRGNANDYGESVKQGVYEMIHYMTNRYADCKAAGSKFVFGGYSQGAQVIGQYLRTAPAEIRSAVAFVALFGDPKLHLPEGEGFNPPACRGEQLSAYRRVIANCDVDNGSLGARKPYLPADMHAKTGLWCYANDFVCGSSKSAWDTAGHGNYGVHGNAVDSAVYEALQKVRNTLPAEQQQHISTKRSAGDGTTGLDVMFVIDTTGSMSGKINQAKQFAAASAARIQALRGRVALVSYRDAGDSYTARIESPLSSDMANFTQKLGTLAAGGGGDTPEAALHALMTGMNGLEWQNGATKAAILLTDANFHDPDRVDGTTTQQVAKRALEIDPVNVYPVVSSNYTGFYHELAELTNGQVIIDSGNTQQALFAALTKLEQRPVALLKNQQYRAEVGQQMTFDASDSYVEDAEITSYDWDFDGDGAYDLATTTPVAKHTYNQLFDGTMQVRLTASNGTIASASAFVKIGTYTPSVAPAAPTELTMAKDNGSSVVISWQPVDEHADSWIISSDGIPLGKVPTAATRVTVGDLVRSEAINLEVTGMMADGTVGASASMVVPLRQPTSQSSPDQHKEAPVKQAKITKPPVRLVSGSVPQFASYSSIFANDETDTSDAPLAVLPASTQSNTIDAADAGRADILTPMIIIGVGILAMLVAAKLMRRW